MSLLILKSHKEKCENYELIAVQLTYSAAFEEVFSIINLIILCILAVVTILIASILDVVIYLLLIHVCLKCPLRAIHHERRV